MSLLGHSKIYREAKPAVPIFDVDMDTVSQLEESEPRLQAIQAFSLEGTSSRRKRGWEATIGTLDENSLVQEIIEAGECIRQTERSD